MIWKKDTLELPNVEIDMILKSKIPTVLGGGLAYL